LATEEDKNSYVEALIVTDKLLAVDKTGRVTIYSTASKIYTDVIKPIIEKKTQTKSIVRIKKKRDKRRNETKKSETRRQRRIKKK